MKAFEIVIALATIFFSQNSTAQNVGIGTLNPVQKLHVQGTTYLNGNVGIGYAAPVFPLSFNGNLGNKISLWTDGTSTHYGFGIQSGLFQMFSKSSTDAIAFGYGSSTSFAETMRIKGNGIVGIGTPTPEASAKLDVNSTNSGFLPPRMTTAQRDAIEYAVPGLMIFNTTTQTIDFYTLYGWSSIKSAIAGANKLLGGNRQEYSPCIQQTSDGGYILAGNTLSSTSGDVTKTNHGSSDIWIVKISATGTIVWNKLLGGNSYEEAYSIQQTTDGGYIVAGSSTSSANGDVSGVNHGSLPSSDYWIVKLDGSGNIKWNKLLGGTGFETAYSIQQTRDGGYIVAGSSNSSANGDVTGTNHGSYDYWIVKLDNLGTILWNKLLGGTSSDIAYSTVQTTDGGYIVAGSSYSSANGDVWGTNHGTSSPDYWIVKLDNSGTIVWNALLGGDLDEVAFSIRQAADGNFIIAGYSTSSANGDVTGTNHSAGYKDFWIVRLDATGSSILWNKLLGGIGIEEAKSIVQTTDGGYIVAGHSNSFQNGDVSDFNHGSVDYWIVKLNGSGNIVWNKLLGGASDEIAYSIQQTADNGYIVAGTSGSSSNGDVTAFNHGYDDFWIIRLDANGNIL